jgi:CheY-like chemotaxis protein
MTPSIVKHQKALLLVIEDNADQWYLVRWALSQTIPDVKPIWVNEAAQALHFLASCETDQLPLPRLILLDLYLPDRIRGWQLLEAIKTHHRYRDIPLVVMSGSAEAEDIQESYMHRANSYLVKPTDLPGWLTCCSHLLQYWWQTVALPLAVR